MKIKIENNGIYFEEYLEILNNNDKGEKGSFIYFLHEKNIFEIKAFWEYYDCLISITKKSKYTTLDREISKKIFRTYSYVLKSTIYHLIENDCLEIKEFPTEKIGKFIERLEVVIEGYFGGYLINEENFDDDLTKQ